MNDFFITDIEKKIINAYQNGKSGCQIAKENNLTNGKVYYVLEKYKVKMRSNKENSRKYFYNTDYFKEINTNEKAYWLGFIYADGYVAQQDGFKRFGLALSIKDIDHLKKFKKSIDATYPINVYEPTEHSYSDNDYCRIEIFGDNIYNLLNSHGVVEHKTDILTAPDINNKFKIPFIRGYFDGDGSVYCSETQYSTKTKAYRIKIEGTLSILNYIKDVIEENNIAQINQYYKRRENNDTWTLDIGGNFQSKLFLDLIYKDSKLFLDRKYKLYQSLKKQIDFSISDQNYLNAVNTTKLNKYNVTKMSSLKETSGVKPL
jgi:hypothetical protein